MSRDLLAIGLNFTLRVQGAVRVESRLRKHAEQDIARHQSAPGSGEELCRGAIA